MQALTVTDTMMKRLALVLGLLCAASARADESFTQSLSPEDFQAAGLGKLTPAELARLDALVRGQQKGAVAKATDETAKAVAAKVRAEDSAAAQRQASSASIVDKIKVVLRPGTEVSYTTLDAALVPGYSGWQRGTVLTLTNGQQWEVTESGRDYSTPTGKPVRVHIVPGSMGSFFMEIEDGGRPRVKFLRNINPPQAAQPDAH
jgi:hypothetical protein